MNVVLGLLGAAVLFAAYTLLGRRLAREHGSASPGGGCPPGGCDACASRPACPEPDDGASHAVR